MYNGTFALISKDYLTVFYRNAHATSQDSSNMKWSARPEPELFGFGHRSATFSGLSSVSI